MALVGHTHVIEEHLVSVRFFVGIYIMPHKHLCEPFLSLESYRSIHLFHISKCDSGSFAAFEPSLCLVFLLKVLKSHVGLSENIPTHSEKSIIN